MPVWQVTPVGPVEPPKTPAEGYHLTEDLATKVTIDVDKDAENVDHFIKPEDRFAVAMALQ